MRVNCYFCEHPQEVSMDNDLFVKRISEATKQSSEEIKNIKWKYICDECTKTERYREWMHTSEARCHMALAKEAKVIE